jgi:hypothetical protein
MHEADNPSLGGKNARLPETWNRGFLGMRHVVILPDWCEISNADLSRSLGPRPKDNTVHSTLHAHQILVLGETFGNVTVRYLLSVGFVSFQCRVVDMWTEYHQVVESSFFYCLAYLGC